MHYIKLQSIAGYTSRWFSRMALFTRMKLAWVCSVSGGGANAARSGRLLISLLGTALRADRNIHTHQIKALHWQARRAKRVEKAPTYLVAQILDGLRAVLDD